MGETRVMPRWKKLIKEAAREKSIRHGNSKTLDLVQYYPTSYHSHGRKILPLQIPLHGVPRYLRLLTSRLIFTAAPRLAR